MPTREMKKHGDIACSHGTKLVAHKTHDSSLETCFDSTLFDGHQIKEKRRYIFVKTSLDDTRCGLNF
jgi:hypothetical protein